MFCALWWHRSPHNRDSSPLTTAALSEVVPRRTPSPSSSGWLHQELAGGQELLAWTQALRHQQMPQLLQQRDQSQGPAKAQGRGQAVTSPSLCPHRSHTEPKWPNGSESREKRALNNTCLAMQVLARGNLGSMLNLQVLILHKDFALCVKCWHCLSPMLVALHTERVPVWPLLGKLKLDRIKTRNAQQEYRQPGRAQKLCYISVSSSSKMQGLLDRSIWKI